MRLSDKDIRIQLHKQILKSYHDDKDSIVINELGLQHGNSRADVAVLNGDLLGFEIKSDFDSLTRLKLQVPAYNSVFDYSTIVISEKHVSIIKKIIPYTWGIIVSKRDNVKIILNEIRKPLLNKEIDSFSLAHFFWKNEVIEILNQFKTEENYQYKNRETLYKLLINRYNKHQIKEKVYYYFKNRKDWRCHELLFQYDD